MNSQGTHQCQSPFIREEQFGWVREVAANRQLKKTRRDTS